MPSPNDHLLEILNAHGQEFLASFGLPTTAPKRKADEPSPRPTKLQKTGSAGTEEEEEWGGIQASDDEDDEDGSDFEQEDDEFTSGVPQNVVVFAQPATGARSDQGFSTAQKKAFLSSKVSKMRDDGPAQAASPSTPEVDEEERTNAQNDALLHRLVHTKLLSGSLNAELDLTPAQRKKALAGRVMELSGDAKLGKGEKRVREGERNKASKSVREGLVRKQKERQDRQLEEAKNLGNYHPTIKKLFDDTSTSKAPKKRELGPRGHQPRPGQYVWWLSRSR
uniref:Uncharacterized protein n=1 Tax=Mycena chlorophos TaxID=658473 RepID=A0ABQ0LSM6_MYCCL|nr:predicted protein [Mycena chlorophos]